MSDDKSTEKNKGIDEALKEAMNRYGNMLIVTSIVKGLKKDGTQYSDEEVLRVTIDPNTVSMPEGLFPESIGGVPLQVERAKYGRHMNFITNKGYLSSIESTNDHKRRSDTLFPGISIAHYKSTAGTLGCIVIDEDDGKPCVLSNWHVLAGADARPDDQILQPGPYDGGRVQQDTVAKLTRMMLDSGGDAAIAKLTFDRGWSPVVFGTDAVIDGVKNVSLGMKLIKSGRTTGVTTGKCVEEGVYFIEYEVGRKGIGGFKIVPLKDGNPDNEEVSEGGDSGSLWYDASDNKAVGLHFGGETNPVPNQEHGIACNLSTVLARLRARIATVNDLPKIAGIQNVPHSSQSKSDWPDDFIEKVLDVVAMDREEFEVVSKHLVTSIPSLSKAIPDGTKPEIGPFGAVLIGFGVGAVTRIIGKKVQAVGDAGSSPEAFPVVVGAFILGAITGARIIDGKI